MGWRHLIPLDKKISARAIGVIDRPRLLGSIEGGLDARGDHPAQVAFLYTNIDGEHSDAP